MHEGTRGTGRFEGMVWDGKRWAVPGPDGQLTRAKLDERPMGVTIAGVVALAVALVLAYLGYAWFGSFTELEDRGNDYSGLLALFGLGAWVLAAAFGITGGVLLSRKRQR